MADFDDISTSSTTAPESADGPEGLPSPEGGGEVEAGRSLRRSVLKWAIITTAVLAVAAIALPGFSVTQAGYYGRYPDLKVRMDHWSSSTHSKMSCVSCHIEPGAGAFLAFGAKAIPAFYSQVLQGPSNSNLLQAPESQACRKCHTQYREVAPSGDLRIPHRAHVEVLHLDCGECHKYLVHVANRRGFNRPEMETCLEKCHDGDTASHECADCHTDKSVPKSHKAKGWLETHGTEAKSQDCGKCHDWTPDYCSECHSKRPASHAGNWKKGHAVTAKQRSSGCLVCHDKGFCKECH